MKKFRWLIFLGIVLFMASCENDDPVQSLSPLERLSSLNYSPNGVWENAESNGAFEVDGYVFSHNLSEWNTIEGFTPACCFDNTMRQPLYDYQFDIIVNRTATDSPYLVGFWSSWEGETFNNRSLTIKRADNRAFTPVSLEVTNTCYVYYTLLYGDDFCKKFTKGDWMRVTAHGVKTDGSETITTFPIAECGENPADGILKDWKQFSLAALGEVVGIYFTIHSSDSGEWGMNTPAYFALRNFEVQSDNQTKN